MSLGVQCELPSVVFLRSSAGNVSVAFPFAAAALRFSIATTNLPPRITPIRCLSALNPSLKATLDKVVTSHKIVLFMKGTKEFPQCGFSNTVVQILTSLNVPFETVNILENEALHQGLKEYSSWPTFPQLYIDGEFFGGSDITGSFTQISSVYYYSWHPRYTASSDSLSVHQVYIWRLRCL